MTTGVDDRPAAPPEQPQEARWVRPALAVAVAVGLLLLGAAGGLLLGLPGGSSSDGTAPSASTPGSRRT
ncbi:hypothetical protein BJF78_12315 [Pseudonocardia sp. CNS-139]|nr:hypothetical protein BJF78_12315 [Pseudonocardia sp. CNS-139]